MQSFRNIMIIQHSIHNIMVMYYFILMLSYLLTVEYWYQCVVLCCHCCYNVIMVTLLCHCCVPMNYKCLPLLFHLPAVFHFILMCHPWSIFSHIGTYFVIPMTYATHVLPKVITAFLCASLYNNVFLLCPNLPSVCLIVPPLYHFMRHENDK